MKKLIAIACILLLCGVSASNKNSPQKSLRYQVSVAGTIDSLSKASEHLEHSAERLNQSLTKIQ